MEMTFQYEMKFGSFYRVRVDLNMCPESEKWELVSEMGCDRNQERVSESERVNDRDRERRSENPKPCNSSDVFAMCNKSLFLSMKSFTRNDV